MMRATDPASGKRILFWDDLPSTTGLDPLLDLFVGLKKLGRPQDFVRHDIPWDDRETLGKALRLRSGQEATAGYPGGDVLMGYMGWADCRICGERLGTRDLFGYGFVWPEKAEHYVLSHKVWTPDCDLMLAAVRRAQMKGLP
jgi:hypothetical protein